MKRQILTLTCSWSLLSGSFLHAAVTVVDFESITAGNQSSTFLAGYGIASVTDDRADSTFQVYNYGSEPDILVPSGTQVFLPTGGNFPSPTGIFNTTLTFDSVVSYFKFSKIAEVNAPYSYGIAGWRAQAFDELNNLVSTAFANSNDLADGLDFPSPGPNQTYTLAGAANIKTVVFTVNYNYQSTSGSVGLDDFEFESVPEPGRCALFGLGLAVCLLRRRRA